MKYLIILLALIHGAQAQISTSGPFFNPTSPVPIGGATPNTGAFTSISISGSGASLSIGPNTSTSTQISFNNGRGVVGVDSSNTILVGGSGKGLNLYVNASTVAAGFDSSGNLTLVGTITKPGGVSPIVTTNTAITSGAGAGAGTILNAPTSGNPTKWIPINDNGTTRYLPAW